jgi:hypothetical protein
VIAGAKAWVKGSGGKWRKVEKVNEVKESEGESEESKGK